jgi:hypothetical protein
MRMTKKDNFLGAGSKYAKRAYFKLFFLELLKKIGSQSYRIFLSA